MPRLYSRISLFSVLHMYLVLQVAFDLFINLATCHSVTVVSYLFLLAHSNIYVYPNWIGANLAAAKAEGMQHETLSRISKSTYLQAASRASIPTMHVHTFNQWLHRQDPSGPSPCAYRCIASQSGQRGWMRGNLSLPQWRHYLVVSVRWDHS